MKERRGEVQAVQDSLLDNCSAEVSCEARQHKSLPCAACCSHVFALTCAACRSCPTSQRAPQTRDCGVTPPMPSPAWAQKTIRSQIVRMWETAGRGAPLASPSPALEQTRARMGRLGDVSTSGQSQVGGHLWQQGGMALFGTVTVTVSSCTHLLVAPWLLLWGES